ncbi:LOW QUALITY PROTEIN: mitochondrial antiviral-signaling protein [Anableps anableps]
MSFANDKLYNGYLRRNMPTIVTKVKVREIMPYLPCLTTHDRENIEAKRETSGNYDGMVLLLECLRRRENWPEQFIQALEACEHSALAATIKQEYYSLQDVNNPSSGSVPTTVVRAHVHQAPAPSHLPVSEGGASGQAAAAQPAEAPPAPPQPAAQAPPPVQAQAPQMAAESPPEPTFEPVTQDEVPRLPSTPPPSPEIQHAQVAEDKHVLHQEPEENSESDIQDPPGDTGSVPQKTSSGKKEAAVAVATSPLQQHPVHHSETDPLQTAAATNDKPQPTILTPVNSDVSDGSSQLTLTPEKHPVQDTTPTVHKVPTAALQPKKSPEHAAVQTVKSGLQIKASPSPEPCPNTNDDFHQDAEDNSMCLSKPTQLISVQPVNHPSPPVQPSSSLAQPYSGNSDRLEISEAESDAVTHLPACTAEVEKAVFVHPCQENGIAPDHREPEENHYESPNQSFEVAENVVHIEEVPSILNYDGQAPALQLQIVNGEPAKGSFSGTVDAADDAVPSSTSHHIENYTPPEPKPLLNSEKTTPPDPSNSQSMTRKYILIGAGVGACALLMALKFKK